MNGTLIFAEAALSQFPTTPGICHHVIVIAVAFVEFATEAIERGNEVIESGGVRVDEQLAAVRVRGETQEVFGMSHKFV